MMDKNLLICGDNLSALDDLVKKGIKVDLIYLDLLFPAIDVTKLFGEMRRKYEALRTAERLDYVQMALEQ